MKKILSFMIAFCCVLSCSLIFSGCDMFHKEHTPSEEWIMDSTHHWHKCDECCKEVDKVEHAWEETVIIEATQTEDGVILYECLGCGMDRLEAYSITTVTEEVWNNAFTLSMVDNFKALLKVDFVDGDLFQGVVIKNGDILYQEGWDNHPHYCSKENDKYYKYQLTDETWLKTEITQADYESECGNMTEDLIFSNFTYNEELKAYEANVEGIVMKAYFESGKLVKLVGIQEGVMAQTLTIEYIETELTLPEII